MPKISLKDILIRAQQESSQMRHFYLGVEHLFIALLNVKGGMTSNILQEYGLTSEYVIDAIRRKVGKGSRHRLWAGIPNTPRADVVLGIAGDLALENAHNEIDERDLLTAILEERDSVAIRVLNILGVDDFEILTETIQNYTISKNAQYAYIDVEYNDSFSESDYPSNDQLTILRRTFYGYKRIRVERRLKGGYSNAILYVVTPIHADNREDAAVVVKIDHVDLILDETRRYENHVKNKLPPLTARLEDRPITPETSNLAGIKYTLISDYNSPPHDLRAIINDWHSNELGKWLKNELFPAFGRIWWRQNRPYRFQVWREYDWLLPPLLTLKLSKTQTISPDVHVLKFPVNRSRLPKIEYGDLVSIENFTVQKVMPDKNRIQLAVKNGTDSVRAYQIEIQGIDFDTHTFYRGEVIDQIVGTVWKTRSEELNHIIQELNPDFSVDGEKIRGDDNIYEKLPNPLFAYESLLDNYINGSLSTIHGDLHLGNIMIGPNQSAFLIDFAHTRDGHTIFDWANLEISLLSDVIIPQFCETWDDIRDVLRYIIAMNKGDYFPQPDSDLAHTLSSVMQVRSIAQECLIDESNWTEYYVALAFCSLRATSWESMPIVPRRFMFMLSALCFNELRTRFMMTSEGETPTPDATDIDNTI